MDDPTRTSPWPRPPTGPSTLSVEDLLDGISEGFVAFDTEWRFVYVNRSAAEYLGAFTTTPAAGLLGKNLWETFPVLAGSQVEENYRRAASGSTFLDFELWSLVSNRCVAYGAMPSPTGLTVFFRDVTEQKRTIEALKASEMRQRSVFENSLEGIVVMAPTGEIFDANPAACRMLGRSVEEITRGGSPSLIDVSDPSFVAYREERRRIGRATADLTLIRGDGTTFPVAAQSAVFLDEGGRERTITTFHDLSEQRRLAGEQARTLVELRDAEEQLRLTFDNAPIGKAVVGLDGRCVRVNQPAGSRTRSTILSLTCS